MCVCVCVCVCTLSHLVMSNSLWPHRRQPARLLCPWNFPGKNTGSGFHFLIGGSVVKNLPANSGDRRCGFDPWVTKISWKRKWQPMGYGLWGSKELDMTERLKILEETFLTQGLNLCLMSHALGGKFFTTVLLLQ